MRVDTLITGVKDFFTDFSVDSLWGYKKVSLLEIDDVKVPTGFEVVIDATTSVDVTVSKQLMQHSAESKKVYMDGTKQNPTKMSIVGHIDTSKLADIQRMADDDVWMFVSMTKDIGGSSVSMTRFGQTSVGSAIDTVKSVFSSDEAPTQLYTDCKPYIIQNLSIKDDGFVNTVEVAIELIEVVMFDYDLQYKFGVKKNKGTKVQAAPTKRTEVEALKYETYFRLQ